MDSSADLNLAYAIGFTLSLILYGVYTSVFLQSLAIIHCKRDSGGFSAKIFYVFHVSIFLVATLYNGFTFLQLIRAFVTYPDGPSVFLSTLTIGSHWENLVTRVITVFMMFMFNTIMVYRCYIIWLGDIRAIFIQLILELALFAFSVISFISLTRPDLLPFTIIEKSAEVNGPLHLVQNLLNTGLIVFRLIRQHQESTEAGLHSLSTSLLHTARIIVESAMAYTSLLLCLTIVSLKGTPYAFTLQEIIPSVIGIVLTLIIIRGHLSYSTPSSESLSRIVCRGLERKDSG